MNQMHMLIVFRAPMKLKMIVTKGTLFLESDEPNQTELFGCRWLPGRITAQGLCISAVANASIDEMNDKDF